jgi:hypothetical protein
MGLDPHCVDPTSLAAPPGTIWDLPANAGAHTVVRANAPEAGAPAPPAARAIHVA